MLSTLLLAPRLYNYLMYKYWKIFLADFQSLLEYRSKLLLSMASNLMSVGIMYLLWSSLLAAGYGSNQYTQQSLAAYYIMISFVTFFTDFSFGEVSSDIREGNLSIHLLLPYNYFLRLFLGALPMMVFSTMVFSISILVFNLFGLNFVFNASNLAWGFLILILASLINFAIAISIGSLAFWFRRVHGFNAFFYGVGNLFSGELIPLDLLPKNFAQIADYLPFKYIFYYPAKFLTTSFDISIYIKAIFTSLLWIAILSIVSLIVWKKGLSNFEATGR